ncbi:MAG: PAS domain-containing sensor histidine kinase [Chloroflexota bacterium]|nr:PAS domain-containing sensor histidine kinase [Chloroflexota bacterium]
MVSESSSSSPFVAIVRGFLNWRANGFKLRTSDKASYLAAMLMITIISFLGYALFVVILIRGTDNLDQARRLQQDIVQLERSDPSQYEAIASEMGAAQSTLLDATQSAIQSVWIIATTLLIIIFPTLYLVYRVIFQPMMQRQYSAAATLRREILERSAAEQRLRLSEERYRLLIQHLPGSAVLLFDHDLRHVVTEGAFLEQLGYRRERFAGRLLEEAVPPDVARRLRPHYESALAGQNATMEGMANGYHFRAQYLPMRDSNDTIIGGMILSQDISNERQAADSAIVLAIEREKTRLLNDFVRDMSHDFRTPLAIVTTNLYLLKRDRTPEKQDHRIDTVQKQISRLARLLEQMVEMSALESGAHFNLHSVDLQSLLRMLQDRFYEQAEQHGIQFEVTAGPDVAIIAADHAYVTRALVSLLENAFRYTPAGGSVCLSAQLTADAKFVSFIVRDDGVGIAADDLPYVFERFYRADKARSTETGGAGLGLTMVKIIAQQHKGSVDIQSAPGKGTSVELRLPVAQSETFMLDD